MAKDRLTPCLYYVCEGQCSKNKPGTMKNYCQTCSKYEPRAHIKYENKKKSKLNDISKKEAAKEAKLWT